MEKDKITYDIVEHFGTFDDTAEAWTGEVNLISWNGKDPKIDIRYWKTDRTKSRKLGTIDKVSAHRLADILSSIE